MEKIVIHETNNTPAILLNGDEGILSITGRSIPEDPKLLYKEVLDGIDEYSKDPKELLNVTVHLEFFNTASARELLKIFNKLGESEFDSNVIWVFEEGDEDMEEAGMDYSEMVKGLSFEFVEVPEEF